jgi:hypothetical protein
VKKAMAGPPLSGDRRVDRSGSSQAWWVMVSIRWCRAAEAIAT